MYITKNIMDAFKQKRQKHKSCTK